MSIASIRRLLHLAVSDKRTLSNDYYLTLSPWEGQKKPVEVSISYALYSETAIKDTIEIVQGKGNLAIPWYVVTKLRRHD